MSYPDPRYQQQPPPGPYPPGPPAYPGPQTYGYPPAGYPNAPQPYPYQQPGYGQQQYPYYPQPIAPQPDANGNSSGWHLANIAVTLLGGRTTRGFGGSARERVIMALICMGIGLIGLLAIVLIGMVR